MGKKELAERDEKLAEMYKAGSTMQEIADAVGMSKQGVSLRLTKLNLSWKDGGAHLRSVRRKAEKRSIDKAQ